MAFPAYGALVGLREMTVEVMNSDGSYQSPIAIHGPQSLSPAEKHVTVELPAADRIDDIYDQPTSLDITAKWGKLDLAILAAITGDSVVLSGSTPTQRQRYTRTITSQAPYFRLKGRTAYLGQGNPGDAVLSLPKCKLFGNVTWVHDQGKYADVNAKFQAIADSNGDFYTMDFNETAADLPTASITAPTVSSTTPTTGATGVSASANVTYTFDKAIQFDSNHFKLFLVTSTTNITEVACAITYNTGTFVVTINPSSDLTSSAKYMAVAMGVKEITGTATLATDNLILFTVA